MRKLVLWLLAMPQMAAAAFSNYNSILIGDQVAGMGGAGTAVVGDVAASSFYNPATNGFLEASAFSAAVGIYKKFDTLYGKEEDITRAPMRVNQGFFRSLPSSTGSALRMPHDWLVAFSIVVPDYDNFKGDLYNKGQNVTTLTYVDESLWVGGSVSKKFNKRESMGVSLYYTARNSIRTVNDRTFSSAAEGILFTSEKVKTDNTLVAIFGYYKRMNKRWSSGWSVRPRSYQIHSKVSVFESTTYVNTGTSTLTQNTVNLPDQDGQVVIPGRLSGGIVYTPDPFWTWSGDVSFYEGVSYIDLQDSGKTAAAVVDHRPTWNFQLGGEYKLLDWLKLRAGVFTDYSSHPDPSSTDRLQDDHMDMYGFSANGVFIAGNQIGYTFGGYYVGGKGLSRQRINSNWQTMSKTQHVFTMLFGTSFNF